MVVEKPILYYSTNTWLSFGIAQRYYDAIHYVWCSPQITPNNRGYFDSHVPPTANPIEVFKSLYNEVRNGDRHSPKVRENKVGILRGASAKRASGIIGEKEEREIAAVIERAELKDFRPLMYIIPASLVADRIREVPVEERAAPLSFEFIIPELPRSCFDVIEFEF